MKNLLNQIKSYFYNRQREKDIRLMIDEQFNIFLQHRNYYHWFSLPYQYVNAVKVEALSRTNFNLKNKIDEVSLAMMQKSM
jgi:DNA polymerase III delta prime subunit